MNKGRIKFDKILLEEMMEHEDSAKAMFTNFYPYAIVNMQFSNPHVMYFGYSEHFDMPEAGQLLPQYDMMFIKNTDGIFEFKEMIKL